MLKLAIDTTSPSGSLAISKDDDIIYEKYFKINITHSETLMPSIDTALSELGLLKKDINELIVCKGPGSFTGIRIGVATAKGIAYGLDIPVKAFTSLEMTAANLLHANKPIFSFIDARMKEVYAALYNDKLEPIIAPGCYLPEDIIGKIHEPVIVVGSGVKSYLSLLQECNNVTIAPMHYQVARASSLFTLDKMFPDDKEYSIEDLFMLEPEYMRLSQAELMKKNNA